MNKQQRKQISEITADLAKYASGEDLQRVECAEGQTIWQTISAVLDDRRGALDSVRDEEEAKYENLSEGLQSGPTGEGIQAAMDTLEAAVSALDDAISATEDEGHTSDEDRFDAIAEKVQESLDELENL